MGWVVDVTTPPLYPTGWRSGTFCAGGWMGPATGLDVYIKFRPSEFRSQNRPALPSRSNKWSQSALQTPYVFHFTGRSFCNLVHLCKSHVVIIFTFIKRFQRQIHKVLSSVSIFLFILCVTSSPYITRTHLMVTLHPLLADFLNWGTWRTHRSTKLCRSCGHTAHAVGPTSRQLWMGLRVECIKMGEQLLLL
jgi:hypothetical protein